ncbi:MAG: HIRAN domain-containing protein [Atopobiaceae bacterium]|nr:HIRAN domain-containing protein [Atopobiaceae bacterium]
MSTDSIKSDTALPEGAGLAPISATSAGAIIAAMHQGNGGMHEVPKPFAQPICLIPETRVAGTSHIKDIDELAQSLREGDRLRLERDSRNPYDHWCIKVLDGEGRRVGFVAADVNEIPARLMDGGKRLYAQVTGVERLGSWWKIGVGVWLDD